MIFALLDHENPIGGPDRRKAMGDHEAGLAAEQFQQCVLNQPFGFRVDRRGGLVHHQQPRPFQDRAGDRNELLLAQTELVAPLANLGGVTLGRAAMNPCAPANRAAASISACVASSRP